MISKGSNQSVAKKANTALIKETIYHYAPISRTEIAQMLGLTTPTVATNVNKLISENLVYECGTSPMHADSLGRKPIMVDFVSDCRMAVGVELGPYHTTLVLTDMRGKIVTHCNVDAAPGNYESMLSFVNNEVTQLIAQKGIPFDKLLGLGIGLPGFIDSDEGIIHESFRHHWNGKALAADVAQLTGLPTRIENNVRARAIGAELFDRTMSTDFFVYFFVSHGLACPLIVKNSPFYGQTAGTGEIGHMVVDTDGSPCDTCGNIGCLESVASESAIIKRCIHVVEKGLPTILTQICADPMNPEIGEILKAQESGDVYVCSIIHTAINYLGIGLANIINFIRPHSILLDGHILSSQENKDLLMKSAQKNVFGMGNRDLDMIFLPFDPLRGAVGGAAIAVNDFLKVASD